jgi:hypothetical protein
MVIAGLVPGTDRGKVLVRVTVTSTVMTKGELRLAAQ